MTYKPPVKQTEHANIQVHNKSEIAPHNAWIVTDKKERETISFFETASIAELRDVFSAVTSLEDDGKGKFILFHAVNPDDEIQHTNSKLPNVHIHAFTGDFAKEFSHISDPQVKSYVVQPNPDLGAAIKSKMPQASEGFKPVRLTRDEGAEIKNHDVLLNANFSSFDDFTARATNQDWEDYRGQMLSLLKPCTEQGQGGARIIIDERYTKTGALTIQVLSGENMDRSGENKQRYFQKPRM
jgi:hypothetical protein